MPRISGLAQTLEDAGKAEDRALLEEKLPELLARSAKLGNELSILNGDTKDTNKGKPEITAEELEKAYSEIREFADDCNNTGIEEIMEKLAQYTLPDAETEKINAINSALEDFDFDRIIELL